MLATGNLTLLLPSQGWAAAMDALGKLPHPTPLLHTRQFGPVVPGSCWLWSGGKGLSPGWDVELMMLLPSPQWASPEWPVPLLRVPQGHCDELFEYTNSLCAAAAADHHGAPRTTENMVQGPEL